MKNTYTANFYTDAEYASTDIAASNPQEALEKAKAINALQGGDGLTFDHYDEGQPVNHIEILDDDHNELVHWRDDDLLLHMAAPDLREALEFCDMTLADLEASKRKGTSRRRKSWRGTPLPRPRRPPAARRRNSPPLHP